MTDLTDLIARIEAQAAKIARLTAALCQSQTVLEGIVRTKSVDFTEVRKRIMANRTALKEARDD